MENVLYGNRAKHSAPQGPQQLQATGTDVIPDEDLQRLVLVHLSLLQFTYQPGIGLEYTGVGHHLTAWIMD